jgi:hypothetical protein
VDDNVTTAGAVMDGAWRWMIETVWFAVAERPLTSVTVRFWAVVTWEHHRAL